MTDLKVSGSTWCTMEGITLDNKGGWETLDSFYDDDIDYQEFQARKAKSKIQVMNRGKQQ